MVINNDPKDFGKLENHFDVIVVDAPCSGSGLFRREPEAINEWSENNVALCSQRQQRILADVFPALKKDGVLIYSTCSYSKEENEDVLDSIFEQFPCISIPLSPDPKWDIIETISDRHGARGYRFYPDKLMGEGFFLSVIQKKQATTSIRGHKINRNALKISKSVEQQFNKWINEESLDYISVGETIHALPAVLMNDFETLKNNLYLKKAGIRVGKPGENEWIPDHELALANFLKYESASIDITKPDALRFLRGEPFDSGNKEKGWRIVSYLGQPMGWIKLLEKRMNNYYPKSWRIRQ
jgi:NOL1/NOP2/fmu family ribosome biogenesis protein